MKGEIRRAESENELWGEQIKRGQSGIEKTRNTRVRTHSRTGSEETEAAAAEEFVVGSGEFRRLMRWYVGLLLTWSQRPALAV